MRWLSVAGVAPPCLCCSLGAGEPSSELQCLGKSYSPGGMRETRGGVGHLFSLLMSMGRSPRASESETILNPFCGAPAIALA